MAKIKKEEEKEIIQTEATTTTEETKAESKIKGEAIEYFNLHYGNIFDQSEFLQKITADSIQSSLLFAVANELRLIREILEKKQ